MQLRDELMREWIGITGEQAEVVEIALIDATTVYAGLPWHFAQLEKATSKRRQTAGLPRDASEQLVVAHTRRADIVLGRTILRGLGGVGTIDRNLGGISDHGEISPLCAIERAQEKPKAQLPA